MTEKPKLGLDWEAAELIAGYYGFPSCVFLLPKKELRRRMKNKKRNKQVRRDLEKIRKIKEEIKELI